MGALTQVALIAASCCAGPIRSLVVVVVVVCCCCIPYQLALIPDFCTLCPDPCTLTFAPCTYGVSLLSIGATIPLAQVVVVTSCNLRWWCFILQPLVQIVHLHMWWFTLCNLRWWCFFIYPHWRKYCTCNRATWWSVYIYIYISTVQVLWLPVHYLSQWLDEKAPPAQVAEGDSTTCASGLSAKVTEWKSTRQHALMLVLMLLTIAPCTCGGTDLCTLCLWWSWPLHFAHRFW